jgi:hypothetical protein
LKFAASAGFYQDGSGRKFPRVQLLTIESLSNHTQCAKHPDHQLDLNFKKAKAESNAAQKELIWIHVLPNPGLLVSAFPSNLVCEQMTLEDGTVLEIRAGAMG